MFFQLAANNFLQGVIMPPQLPPGHEMLGVMPPLMMPPQHQMAMRQPGMCDHLGGRWRAECHLRVSTI